MTASEPTPPARGRGAQAAALEIHAAGSLPAPALLRGLPALREALPEHKAILLADGVSVGAVLEVTPIGTEGRTADYLGQVRDTLQDALQDSFDEHDTRALGDPDLHLR